MENQVLPKKLENIKEDQIEFLEQKNTKYSN